ncbi:MAG: hypothetical protein Q9O62_10960 [Ardenticatenia bacterium]|nr:hypothetical protein [Ardenticatenia bacterium]
MNAPPSLRPTDPVLIAYVPRPRDLDLARQQHWYRVPADRAPRALEDARALAFYQGGRFGEERWRVAWWAPVVDRQHLPRRELLPQEPDHPRADHLYVRVDLGPLTPLPHPLVARRGRRLLFKPTTWGELLGAATLDDLFAARHAARAHPLYPVLHALWPEELFHIRPGEARQLRLLKEPPLGGTQWARAGGSPAA